MSVCSIGNELPTAYAIATEAKNKKREKIEKMSPMPVAFHIFNCSLCHGQRAD